MGQWMICTMLEELNCMVFRIYANRHRGSCWGRCSCILCSRLPVSEVNCDFDKVYPTYISDNNGSWDTPIAVLFVAAGVQELRPPLDSDQVQVSRVLRQLTQFQSADYPSVSPATQNSPCNLHPFEAEVLEAVQIQSVVVSQNWGQDDIHIPRL
jgi:hypothetical protein